MRPFGNPGVFELNQSNHIEGYRNSHWQELSFWDGRQRPGDVRHLPVVTRTSVACARRPVLLGTTFDAELAQFPDTVLIWFQVCTGKNTGTEQVVDTIIDLIRQRTAVPIYVSALDASPSCTLGQPDVAQDLADYLVANRLSRWIRPRMPQNAEPTYNERAWSHRQPHAETIAAWQLDTLGCPLWQRTLHGMLDLTAIEARVLGVARS